MNEIFVISLIWSWHAFWMALLTYSIAKAAFSHTGLPVCSPTSCDISGPCRWRIVKWPVSGRWLLTFLCLMITLMILDVARVSWRVWSLDYPTSLSWDSVLLRASPIWIEPWTFWRQWRRGLTNDYPATRRGHLRRLLVGKESPAKSSSD